MVSIANTVTISTDLNVDPYYDDFNETKNFHRILFRPGLAVQARELTQMQSILQNQIDRFAEHIFKEGSVVRGCQTLLDKNVVYMKLRDLASNGITAVNVYAFLNRTVTGATSGVSASVIKVNDGSEANTPNFKTLFVKFTGGNSDRRTFANGEIITASGGGGLTANLISSGATGYSALMKINEGIVYAKDHFIRTDPDLLVISKYSSNATARIGFNVIETIVKEADDSTLLDPASGAYNFAAPGAARLKLTAQFTRIDANAIASNNFVELIQLKDGEIQSRSDTPQYNLLKDYIAQRTYDESGNYIVSGFSPRLREHLLVGNNQGIFTVSQGGNSSKLIAEINPGKAYVQGYDIELLQSKRISIDKATDFNSVEQASTLIDYGNYILADNVAGTWDVNGQSRVSLRSQQANAVSTRNYSTTSAPGSEIGTARVRAVELHSGTPGLPSALYRVYLTDINMNAGFGFNNVQAITYSAGGGSADGRADILGSNGLNANTTDPSFDIAVFRLPANAVRRLRDTTGNVDNNFRFEKSFDITFGTGGTASVLTGRADETFSGSGVLSSASGRQNYYVVARGSGNTAAISTLRLSTTSGSNTLTRSNSSIDLTTRFNPGELIRVANTGDFIVTTVSASSLNTLTTAGATRTGMRVHKLIRQGQILDFAGPGSTGSNRTITVSSSTQTDFNLQETLGSSLNATVITELNKVDGQEASKTANRNRRVQIRIGAGGGTSYVANTTGPWPLGLSDGFKLVSVRRKSGSNFASLTEGTDVTNSFTLDTGMLDDFYSHARLVRKSGSGISLSTGDRLLVTLDHFTHSYSAGVGYFSVDSYPVDDVNAGTDTTKIFTYEIPVYNSPRTGIRYDLRDCIDIRPRMTDTANSVTSLTNISINPRLSTAFDQPSGGLRFMAPGENFTADLDYYLLRNDRIVLDRSGNFSVTKGVPSLNPTTPDEPKDTMSIATINLTPYPSLPDEQARRVNRGDLASRIFPIKNPRFTMRDIGVLRDRIENLEYYTTLNLLEMDTKNLLVQDSLGNNRFKNGILVDPFHGHNVGDVRNSDYKIAIDRTRGEARPPFKLDNIELFYNAANSTNVVRTNVTTGGVAKDQIVFIANSSSAFANGSTVSSGGTTATLRFKVGNKLYVENATGNFVASSTISSGAVSSTISGVYGIPAGEILTLPYTHEVFVNQPYNSTTRNAAGLFWKWDGSITLDPPSDYWVDTVQLPDILVNIDNFDDNWEQSGAWGTVWGDWQTVAQSSAIVGANAALPFGGIQTTTVQTSSGITSSLVPVTTTVSVGNRLVSSNIQPFMRSREIRFIGRGIKPTSRVYPFFDGTSVAQYVTPTNAAFANTANEGGPLVSTANGNVYGIFRLPANENIRFRTGSRIFRLTDSPINDRAQGTFLTSADAIYTSEGLTQEQQNTIISTRNPEVVTSHVTDTRNVTTIIPFDPPVDNNPGGSDGGGGGDNGGDDPIAQSFTMNINSIRRPTPGAFVTKVDLFFATKDSQIGCEVHIRSIDPLTNTITNRIVPFSRVILQPAEINTSTDGSAPTPVYFQSPVYLQDGRDYAIVVKPVGANPNYNMHIARLGEVDRITGNRISAQPATGILSASSNDKVYSAIQEEDLKFTLYVANFDTATTGSVVFKNELKDYYTIANATGAFIRAGEAIHGETILVGTFANTKAVNTGVTFVQGVTSGATGTISRFSSTQLRVRNVSLGAKFRGGEQIRIRNTNATTGVIVGNSSGGITSATTPTGKASYYDAVSFANTYLHLSNVAFTNSGPASGAGRVFFANNWIRGQTNGFVARIVQLDRLQADVINISSDFLSPTNTSIRFSGRFATSNTSRDSNYFNLNVNADTEFSAPRYILSRSMESNTSISGALMASARSAELRALFNSTNRYASPILDVKRISATTVQNLINNNTTGEANTASGGNALARYITRKVTLADGQDAEDIRVYVSAYRPPGSNISVYYKILHREDSDTFDNARWIPMSLTAETGFTSSVVFSSSEIVDDFKEYVFVVPNYSNGFLSGANTTNSNIIEYRNSARSRFVGYKYLSIKVVLTNSTTTNPPRLDDIRVIALQR